ncbi:hypothetical protein OROMI_010093 [Orobanche minor]
MKSKGLYCYYYILVSSVCLCSSAAENTTTTTIDGSFKVNLTVNGETPTAVTDESFICATMDWWPMTKCNFGQCPWGNASVLNLDLENKILAHAVKAFGNLRLRIGGSLQDRVVYKVGSFPKDCLHFRTRVNGLFGFSRGCLDMGRWDHMNKFFNETGAIVTFGLNALTGRRKSRYINNPMVGNWDPRNALEFMNYTASKGYKIDSYEFGNELCGEGVGARVGAHQYGKDVTVLKNLTEGLYPADNSTTRPKLLGPGGFYDSRWFNIFLNTSGREVVDGLTHHLYSLGSGNDPTIIDKVQDPEFLDQVYSTYTNISNSIKLFGPWTSAWVSEAGGAYTSGSKNVSRSFADGFWYLDQLGIAASHDTKVFCRQTLIGGNYGLLDTTTFIPKPDYYGALLWHRLMGTKVLAASHRGSKYLRVYSHCSKNTTGITVLMINMSNSTRFEATVVVGDSQPYTDVNHKREEYHLTPKEGNILSDVVLLNGTPLNLTESSDIPALNPKLIDPKSPIIIAPNSIVFATLKDVPAAACA